VKFTEFDFKVEFVVDPLYVVCVVVCTYTGMVVAFMIMLADTGTVSWLDETTVVV
jgi:hypothetical protein